MVGDNQMTLNDTLHRRSDIADTGNQGTPQGRGVHPTPSALTSGVTYVTSECGMSLDVTYGWYRKPAIRDAIIEQCDFSREVAITQKGYFTRNLATKDALTALNGAGSIYASVERFKDPMKPETRFGWDFAIDLDGSDWNETRWIVAKLFRDVILPQFEIKHARFKFSGNRGIHIIIPEEAFLFYFKDQDFAKAYPLIPSQIANFFDALIYPESKKLCKLDHSIYTSRRLLRCAYSLHDETGLVSVPIRPEDLDTFDPRRDAAPENVQVDPDWFRQKPVTGEASYLLDKVREWLENKPERKQKIRATPSHYTKPGRIMPCIERLLAGGFSQTTEGSRNLILFNVIQATKRFNLPITQEALMEANSKSPFPLPEREVKATLRYHFEKRGKNAYFFKTEIMRDAGLCPPEGCWLCRRNH